MRWNICSGYEARDYEIGTVAVRITEVRRESSGIVLEWNSVAAKAYQVQHSTNLQNWNDTGAPVTAATEIVQFVDNSALPVRKFYRVVCLL